MGTKAVGALSYGTYVLMASILSGITILASYATESNPNNSILFALLAIALPGLLILNLIVFLIWLFARKFILLIIPITAIVWNYPFLSSIINHSSQIVSPKEKITIATYNIHGFKEDWTGYTPARIAEFMKEKDVDIVCFQEFLWSKYLNKKSIDSIMQNYSYDFAPTHNDRPRICVYSKFPIVRKKFYQFKHTDNCAMYVDLKIHNQIIRIFNVHLQTTNFSSAKRTIAKEKAFGAGVDDITGTIINSLYSNQGKRALQADFISKEIELSPYPVVVCGDFNDIPSSYTYRRILGKLNDGWKEAGNGYEYTFNGLLNLLRIDYILHTKEMECFFYKSYKLKYSDHNPVISSLTLP